jgi:hypothetical protein
VQQPFTAQSKLKGLGKNAQPPSAPIIFACAEDYDEPALLSAKIDALDPIERRRLACERISRRFTHSPASRTVPAN